jgi:hypothetical protein
MRKRKQPPQHKYTPEEIRFIKKNIAGRSYADMTEMFNRRFGISLTFAAIKEAAHRRGLYSGLDGRFKPGCSYYSRPIGAESLDGNGYVKVKTVHPRVWKYKHHIIWEKANGPVPEGHVVIFADGNKLNCDLDNLLLVSRGELITMNRLGVICQDRDLTKTGKLIADLTMQINDRKRRMKKEEIMKNPRTCKYCANKTDKAKCPYFESRGGKLPDNGYCKKFKKANCGGNQ